jgi:hypothetical protein
VGVRGARLAPHHAPRDFTSHLGISRPRACFLNNKLRGSYNDPRNERERARIQQDMEDESGHGTLPITTQSLLSRRGAYVTPEAWRKGDGARPNLSSGTPVG